MAKMYYNLDEALAKLGCDEETLKCAVRDGKLREFRDAGTTNYKVDEVDQLAASGDLTGSGALSLDMDAAASASLGPLELADTGNPMPDLSTGGSMGVSDTGMNLADTGETELGLSDASGINLSLGGDDMVSLDEADTQTDAATPGKSKEDTVVSSVGVSVFDEEELDESADPMAKTVMSGTSSGTGLEGVGSGGSGLLDLTRESDDTSLGAELLDEIYPGGEEGATVEMGDATRAGLEGAVEPETKDAAAGTDAAFEPVAAEAAPKAATGATTVTVTTVEYAPDAFSYGSSALLMVALVVTCFTGLAVASMVRGVLPSILDFVFGKLWMFGVGAVVVAGAAMGLGIFLGKRSES